MRSPPALSSPNPSQRRHGPELLRVDHDADRPDEPPRDLEGRDALGTSVREIADDTGPPVDPGPANDESWWGLAEYPEDETGDPVLAVDGVQRRPGLSPAVRPEGYVLGEHRDEAFHVAAQGGFEEARHQALLLLGGALEPGAPGRDRVPRPPGYLAAVRLALVHEARDLLVVVIEDLAQQKDRPLCGVEALEQHEEGHREGLVDGNCIRRLGRQRLGQPGPHVFLAPRLGGAELVYAEAGG